MRPQIFLLAEKQIQFAKALSELSNRIELTKKSMDQLSDMIVYSCEMKLMNSLAIFSRKCMEKK